MIHRLPAVDVAALVVWGSEDAVAGPAHGRAWAGALGRADLVVVDGGGHLPCQRPPGTTFAVLDTFLSPLLTLTA